MNSDCPVPLISLIYIILGVITAVIRNFQLYYDKKEHSLGEVLGESGFAIFAWWVLWMIAAFEFATNTRAYKAKSNVKVHTLDDL